VPLGIPGEELPGVISGVKLLKEVALGEFKIHLSARAGIFSGS